MSRPAAFVATTTPSTVAQQPQINSVGTIVGGQTIRKS